LQKHLNTRKYDKSLFKNIYLIMDNLKSILSSFKLKNELNSKVWEKSKKEGYTLNPKVRTNLLEISYDFIESLKVDVVISDIIMTGSLANYNWSNYSDIDLHIIADFGQFSKNVRSLYEELFRLKKTVYGAKHDIKIFGYDVELYVEDESIARDVKGAGRYSILHNEWTVKPPKESFKIREKDIKEKAKKWMKIIDGVEETIQDEDIESAKKLLKKYTEKIRKYRECGLEKGGEYSDENLVFKILRRNGYLDRLKDMKNKLIDKKLSIKESITTIGDEFKVDLENGPANHGKRAFGNWQSDNAWDVFAPAGTVVNSYTDGVVSKVYDNGKRSGKVFGTQINVKGENGYPDIFYTHLTNVKLSSGDKVNVGDYIGEIIQWCVDENCSKKMDGTHVHIGLPRGNHLKDLINDKVFKGGDGKNMKYEKHDSFLSSLFSLFGLSGKSKDKNFEKIVDDVGDSKFLKSIIDIIDSDKILKNIKTPKSKIPYDKDVEIIQTALQFLGFSLPKWGVDGLFGPETQRAVESFEEKNSLKVDGELNSNDLKVLLSNLSEKGFTDEKLSGIQRDSDFVVNGQIDLSKGKFNGEQLKNINLIINELNNKGITNPYTQAGILSVIGKESNFNTYKEIGYSNTSNSRIRNIFGRRVSKYSDSELSRLKQNDEDFFDAMYGMNSGMKLGNTMPGDGWRYVGRGMNGLTGRANYRKYGNMIGVDLESNPEKVEDPEIAAKVAVAFFTKNKPPQSIPNFENKQDAVNYFADINAGGRSSFSREAADKYSTSFGVIA